MQPSTIEEQMNAFLQRIAASERLYRDAIDALRQQLEQVSAYRQPGPQPPPRRRLLRMPWLVVLIRGSSRLVFLAFRRQADDVEMEPGSGSVSEPGITDVDVVYVEPAAAARRFSRLPSGSRSPTIQIRRIFHHE
jgi:hypothetical protein